MGLLAPMKSRRLKIAAVVIVIGLAIYVSAFFGTVGAVHVTYGPVPGPRPPQFLMYASSKSVTTNKIAWYVFFPLIRLCEATGEFGYVTDPTDFDTEAAPLLPKLWAVLVE